MKTLALAICLCSAAIIAAILAPGATSSTTDQRRIASLEARVDQLATQANCIRSGIPVTQYTRPGGTPYLAATRRVGQPFMWVVVVTPGCLHRHPSKSELGWKW
jgi:hypothetical protein